MATTVTRPDTSRDEEIARGLQADAEPTTATATSATGGGTIVALPMMAYTGVEIEPPAITGAAADTATAASDDSQGKAPAAATARRSSVSVAAAAASPEHSALMFSKMAFLVQALACAGLAWWVFSVVFRAWWFVLSFGVVLCPCGWLGARRGSARLVTAFCGYLVCDLVLQVLFPFVYAHAVSAVGLVVCLLLVVFQVLAAFYTWRFRQMLLLAHHRGSSVLAFDPLL
jgi:hypothetical protein